MVFKHLRDELKDAEAKGWREEARLVSRNSILIAAAALCPLGVLKGIAIMVLWQSIQGMPDLMANTAYLYPLTALICIALAVLMHNKELYTGAMLVALAPFLWVLVFIGSGLFWALE